MNLKTAPWLSAKPGVWAALVSAFLFGAGTPLAKWLLGEMSPWMLAGLLYLGSGVGLAIYRGVRARWGGERAVTVPLKRGELRWLMAAVICGGGIAPVLLMLGLSNIPSSHAALLLNAEAVLTTLLAWAIFKENLGLRLAVGMTAIVAGAVVLGWPGKAALSGSVAAPLWPAMLVLLACFFWALDNNFTRKVSLSDASWIACIKGLVAGTSNLLLAFVLGGALPAAGRVVAALGVGFLAYGVSLALFVVALRHLGASRAGAYFSTAPFVGALISVLFFAEPVTGQLLVAAAMMAWGIWLHLTERHGHLHQHEMLEHEHPHSHAIGQTLDVHHAHDHLPAFEGEHSHSHRHEAIRHTHAHFPDAHHRHTH